MAFFFLFFAETVFPLTITVPNFLEALERTKIPCCPPFTVLFVRLITFLVLVVAFGAEPFFYTTARPTE